MIQVEYKKIIPVQYQFDVVVVGGGPAGIAAAVSASRNGAKTALIERYGALGGNLTLGHVNPILGSVAPGTIYDEIVDIISEGHEDNPAITRNGKEVHIDPDEAKGKFARFVLNNRVNMFLQAPVADVLMEDKTLRGILVCSPMGLISICGQVFVDATGDGYLSYLAGAQYHFGRDIDKCTQPVSIEFTVEGVDESIAISCFGGSDPVKLSDGMSYVELCKEMCKKGILPENVSVVRLHKTFYPGERNVNATQLNECNVLSLEDIAYAEGELRRQVDIVWQFLRCHVPGYENCRIKSSSDTLGIRESRRVVGEYIMCDKDVEKGSRFPDVVVHRAWFLIDIHNPTGGGQAEKFSQPANAYDIPYRALIPLKIDGLILSGRCISGTHRAHASYRVMGICMAVGQAAGVAAALSVKNYCMPRKLPVEKVQQALQQAGCTLFDYE